MSFFKVPSHYFSMIFVLWKVTECTKKRKKLTSVSRNTAAKPTRNTLEKERTTKPQILHL